MRHLPNLSVLPLLAAMTIPAAAMAQVTAPLPPQMPWHGASETLVAAKSDPWITPIEASEFVDTPSYEETRAWFERLAKASPLITLHDFGVSAEGRRLYYVRAASRGAGKKPVLLAQAGIHGGEIDGKDAGMMLMRDIAMRGKSSLLDRADFVLVPIFNVDGHERSSPFNRPNQRGPRNMGFRTTAQNLNLNRDYIKADTPEMNAMLALLRRLDPALYLDLHVTDGSDYQYDITFAFSGWDGLYTSSPAIARWLNGRFRPGQDAALVANGHVPGMYVDQVDPRDPAKGVNLNPDMARFSTGYGDRAHIPTVLLETHSLKPYRRRVLGTYVFVEQALKLVGQDGAAIAAAKAADAAARPRSIVHGWKPLEKPLAMRPFLNIAYERYASPITGRPEVRWLGRPETLKVPVLGQTPDVVMPVPRAWWVPASANAVIRLLDAHGIRYERIGAPRTLSLDMVRIGNPKLGAVNEGHVPVNGSYTHRTEAVTMPAGSVRVSSDQPRGLIAATLLEAESADSALQWNLLPAILQRTEYMEAYIIEPMARAMLARDPQLKAAFEQRLATDVDFARNPNARLQWFYERSPYYDQRYLLYPVGREL